MSCESFIQASRSETLDIHGNVRVSQIPESDLHFIPMTQQEIKILGWNLDAGQIMMVPNPEFPESQMEEKIFCLFNLL